MAGAAIEVTTGIKECGPLDEECQKTRSFLLILPLSAFIR